MQTLSLQVAMTSGQDCETVPLLFHSKDATDTPQEVWVTPRGELRPKPTRKRSKGRARPLLTLLCRDGGAPQPSWLMLPLDRDLLHNGVRPLPLAVLQPGDVLAVGEYRWFAAEVWQASPFPAPASVAERECPVCGGYLSAANVVQCPCGRYYHLEMPEDPDNENALNCYLTAGECGLCHKEPSLEPQFLPTPPEELIHPADAEAALASVV